MRRTMIPFVMAAGLVSLCMSASALVVEEDPDLLAAEFEQHSADVKAELDAGSKAEWAGEYHFGDGLGVNVHLVVAPDRGFASIWTGCLGVYGRNYGTVAHRDGRLVLNHAKQNEPGTFGSFSKVLIPVPWGARLYLIGEEQLGDFVNAVNSGFEPCSQFCTRFLLRSGDEDVEVTGRPELPAEYASHLLGEPVYARVVRTLEPDVETVDEEYRWRKATVELDVGRNGGIWTGMEFYSTTGAMLAETFTVVRVDDFTSVATVSSYEARPLAPKNGTCVSTFVDELVQTKEEARPSNGCG